MDLNALESAPSGSAKSTSGAAPNSLATSPRRCATETSEPFLYPTPDIGALRGRSPEAASRRYSRYGTRDLRMLAALPGLTSSAADSPVHPSLRREDDAGATILAGSGRICSESFKLFTPAGSWQRTFLDSLATTEGIFSTRYLHRWSRKATKRSRRLFYQLQRLRPRTKDTGSGLLQSPIVPTPASRDYRSPNLKPYQERGGGKKGEQLQNYLGGQLNPTWESWLMGYPLDWLHASPQETLGELCQYLGLPAASATAGKRSKPSATPSSRKSGK